MNRVQDSLLVQRVALTINDSSRGVIVNVTPGSSESLITGTLSSEVAGDFVVQLNMQILRWEHNQVDEYDVTHLELIDRHRAVVSVDGLREPEGASEVEKGKVILRLHKHIVNARSISVAAHVELAEQPGDRRQDPETPNATVIGDPTEAEILIGLEGAPGTWFRIHIALSLATLREI